MRILDGEWFVYARIARHSLARLLAASGCRQRLSATLSERRHFVVSLRTPGTEAEIRERLQYDAGQAGSCTGVYACARYYRLMSHRANTSHGAPCFAYSQRQVSATRLQNIQTPSPARHV